MKSAKRIALLFHSLAIKGGAGNVTIWLANALASRGYDTVVLTPLFDPSLWPQELLSNFSIQVFPNFSLNILAKRSKVYRRRLFGRYLSTALGGYDVVIPNNSPAIQWVQIAKRRNSSINKVLWLCQEPTRQLFGPITDTHFYDPKRYQNGNGFNAHIAEAVKNHEQRMCRKARKRARDAQWEIEAASAASVIIANSRFSAQNIKKVYSTNAEVIYPGIFSKNHAGHAPKRSNTENYIGCVGRLSVAKNVHNVIDAFRIFCENGAEKTLQLRIVGDGPQRMALQEKVSQYGIEKRVVFLGQISDKALPEFYANSRLTVYVPIDEPYGLVPVESLYYKTPIIVSDHGGPGEVFTHQENAYMVDPFDPIAIADMIARCLNNADEAAHMAQKGRAFVKSSLAFEGFVDRLEQFF
jgi:glycosyltransferase involved in cell wall biosynthesis